MTVRWNSTRAWAAIGGGRVTLRYEHSPTFEGDSLPWKWSVEFTQQLELSTKLVCDGQSPTEAAARKAVRNRGEQVLRHLDAKSSVGRQPELHAFDRLAGAQQSK